MQEVSFARSKLSYTVADVKELPIDDLESRLYSARSFLDHGYAKRLSIDLLERGQLSPIKVQEPNEKDPRHYKVIDGEHRIAAARLVHIPKLRAEILIISDEDARALAIRANRSRSREIETLELACAVAGLQRPTQGNHNDEDTQAWQDQINADHDGYRRRLGSPCLKHENGQ